MQLIIPMSGFGQRFIKKGYKIPKPLIEIEDKEIISHIYQMFPGIDSITFICNEKHLNDPNFKMMKKIKNICNSARVISIDPHKNGPIYAVLKASKFIDLNLPTIVNYCDFNCIWDYKKFKNYVKKTNCDGCVVTYTGFHPHMLDNTNYAYVKLDNSQIIDIQEKKSFTSLPMQEHASNGTYYFKSGFIMKKYFEKTIERDLNVKGEYYVSMSYKAMLEDNLKLNNFNIKYFMQWGTPEDLEEYRWFSSMFKAMIKKEINNPLQIDGLLMIPCAGMGKRFSDFGYKSPKPLVKVSGKPMFIQAIKDLPIMEKTKLIVRKDMDMSNELCAEAKKYLSRIEIQLIESLTNGQAATCLLGLKKNDLEKPLIISACDNGLIYKKREFEELIGDKSIDIIVFGSRGYPGAIKKPNMYGWIEEYKGLVKRIHVKTKFRKPEQDPIVTGTFYFKQAKIYKEIAEDLIKNNQKVNNEFYIDSAINNALESGFKVAYFEVDYYLCWGTPNDLKTYKYWQNCFNEWTSHEYKKELDDNFKQPNEI